MQQYLDVADRQTFDDSGLESSEAFEEAEFNLEALVESVIQSNAPVPPDIRVDDRDLPVARNFYEFATSRSFLGFVPYAKQVEVGLKLFAEYCPRCSDMDYLENVPVGDSMDKILERVIPLEHGVCPRCNATKNELIHNEELVEYAELAGLAGQRSGKSASVSLYANYTNHRFLKLQNPVQVFGLLPNSALQGTFVALTFQQAVETLWTPILNILSDTGNWFGQYHKMLDYYSTKYSEELYALKDTLVRYRHRSLLIYPSGPNMKTLRGRTRFVGAIDEIGWFDTKSNSAVKMNANEVYIAMQRSFQTLRGAHNSLRQMGIDAPIPLFANVSSPASQFDKIVGLHRESIGSSVILGFKYATWEMNPTLPRNSKFLEDEFRRDFQGAMRDYGANPPMSSSAFISELMHLKEAVQRDMVNGAYAEQRLIKTPSGRVQRTGRPVYNWKDANVEKILAIDAGFSNNSFAVVIMHNHPQTFVPVVDVMLEVIPAPQHPINYTDVMESILSPLIEAYGVTMVVSDRWQSIKLLQDLEAEHGIEAYSHSVKYPDFDLFRQNIYDGNIMIPWPEVKPRDLMQLGADDYPNGFKNKPVAHFLFQCLTVEDYPGVGVEKGLGTTDDIFRATVLAHRFLVDEAYKMRFAGAVRRRVGALGVVVRGGENRVLSSSVGVLSRGGGGFSSGASTVGVRR